jgi:Tol biopolymer transport system component
MAVTAGTNLNQYELLRLLGAGGMGQVWLARDGHLARPVAIKLLPPALTTDADRLRRFEHEARAASSLNHPNVCTIHAFEQAPDGQRFIVMEHIDGQTLRARVSRGRVTLRERLDVSVQIASALSAAHAAGVVHRDLKPENVMIRADGLVKVLDFGLAKLTARESDSSAPTETGLLTAPGVVMGTATYMSPEQARGMTVDARTDVWSLGVIMYEMAAGRAPFSGQSQSDTIAAILEREYEPLNTSTSDAPAELVRIVGRALRKDPGQRYQVVKDLQLDLEALRDDPVLRASVASPSHGVTTAHAKGPAWIAAAFAVGVVVATAAGAWWHRRPASNPVQPPASAAPVDRPQRRLTFDQGLQTDAAFSPDGRSIVYASDRSGNFDIWVRALDGTEARQLTQAPSQETQPAWSPDGTRIVFRSAGPQAGLFLISAKGGRERQLTSFGADPVWSSDASEVFFRMRALGDRHAAIYSVSPDGGEAPREIAPTFFRNGDWQWIAPRPDGRISGVGQASNSGWGFYTVSRDGAKVTASKLTKDPRWLDLVQNTQRFQWNEAGTALYLEVLQNEVVNVWRMQVDSATLEWLAAERLTRGAGRDVNASLAPVGGRMAFTVETRSTRLWRFALNADAGRITIPGTPFTPEDDRAEGSSLSADGRLVSFRLRRVGNPRADLLVLDLATKKVDPVGEDALQGTWAPDSRTLVYSILRQPQSVSVAQAALGLRKIGGPERIIKRWTDGTSLFPTGWTPDGRFVVGSLIPAGFSVATGATTVVDWPISPDDPQKERVLLADPGLNLWQGSYSPDGRWLTFVAQSRTDWAHVTVHVARPGAPASEWIRIAPNHLAVDKPRWSPNGRLLYFVSTEGSPYFNLWAVKFDPDRGMVVGDPFRITRFDSPDLKISSGQATMEIGIAAGRALLEMEQLRGNIWLMENVDR